MLFVADESVDRPIVERLRRDGHEIVYINEIEKGITDKDVLTLADQYKAPLITLDKDFGELVFRQKLVNHGVILIRLFGLPNAEKISIVSHSISEHCDEMYSSFVVISNTSVRIRPSSS